MHRNDLEMIRSDNELECAQDECYIKQKDIIDIDTLFPSDTGGSTEADNNFIQIQCSSDQEDTNDLSGVYGF